MLTAWCYAVADEVGMRSALERFDDIDLNFPNSREANFLKVCPLHTASHSCGPHHKLAHASCLLPTTFTLSLYASARATANLSSSFAMWHAAAKANWVAMCWSWHWVDGFRQHGNDMRSESCVVTIH